MLLTAHPGRNPTESDASLVYTTDPVMGTELSKADPVQGGFLLVRPDLKVYEELRTIIREVRWLEKGRANRALFLSAAADKTLIGGSVTRSG